MRRLHEELAHQIGADCPTALLDPDSEPVLAPGPGLAVKAVSLNPAIQIQTQGAGESLPLSRTDHVHLDDTVLHPFLDGPDGETHPGLVDECGAQGRALDELPQGVHLCQLLATDLAEELVGIQLHCALSQHLSIGLQSDLEPVRSHAPVLGFGG